MLRQAHLLLLRRKPVGASYKPDRSSLLSRQHHKAVGNAVHPFSATSLLLLRFRHSGSDARVDSIPFSSASTHRSLFSTTAHVRDAKVKHQTESPQVEQLQELRDIILACGDTNSRKEKEATLHMMTSKESAELLLFLYDEHVRLYVKSAQLLRFLQQHGLHPSSLERKDDTGASNVRDSIGLPHEEDARRILYACGGGELPKLRQLLGLLDSREVSGHLALSVLAVYLQESGILGTTKEEMAAWTAQNIQSEAAEGSKPSIEELIMRASTRLSLLECFCRCLDRNLKAGFSARTVRAVFGGMETSSESMPVSSSMSSQKKEKGTLESNSIPSEKSTAQKTRPKGKSAFEVALGKPVEDNELDKLFVTKTGETQEWLVSRKLDGVRCVVQVDVALPLAEGDLDVLSVECYSRSGRHFQGLEKLEKEVQEFVAKSTVARRIISKILEDGEVPGPREAHVARLYLDGECCALIPRHDAPSTSAKTDQSGQQIVVESSPVSSPPMPGQEEEDPLSFFVEDFTSISSALQRKYHTVPRPAFFPFDILTYAEFTQWRSGASGASASFEERIRTRVEHLADECELMSKNLSRVPLVRKLRQEKVDSIEQVHRWIAEAAARGWEGLILRRAASPYAGKRSTDIRKFKQWRDDEYVVEDVSINEMRLPIGKKYAQRRALASVWIDHKGVKVSIGSGFSVEQRLAFAENPNLIIGKEITVQYFEESESSARSEAAEGGEGTQPLLSLRFPRVKKVWLEGRRDM